MVYDLIIIGGGPAAMSAGIYGARKKLKTLLLAKELGGQQMIESYQMENYLGYYQISGVELVQKFIEHLKKFEKKESAGNYDLEIKEGESVFRIEKIPPNLPRNKFGAGSLKREEPFSLPPLQKGGWGGFSVYTEKNQYQTKTIIIATGKRQRILDVPGAKQFEGKGITYCATCDAPLFNDKIVAVVGAGDAGQDTAWQLVQYAKKVYIINKYPELRGSNVALSEKLKASEKVEIIGSVLPKEVKGDKFVRELIYFNPETKEEGSIKIDGIFVEIGSVPNTDFLNGLLELNQKGEIIIDHRNCATSVPGIFAAGDVTDLPYKQVVIAAGEGAKAALSAYEYLKKISNYSN